MHFMNALINFPKGHKVLYVVFGVPYVVLGIICDWWLEDLNISRGVENLLELVVLFVIIFMTAWSMHVVIGFKELHKLSKNTPSTT